MDEISLQLLDTYCKQCANLNRVECTYCQLDKRSTSTVPSQYQPRLTIGPVRQKLKYEMLAMEIGQLVDEKNEAYGDSANTSSEAFKLLYPNGIKPEQYSDALLLVRVWDKMKRIATRKDAFGESPFKDIAGYGLLGAMKDGGK